MSSPTVDCRPRAPHRRRWHVSFALTTLLCATFARVGEPQQPRGDEPAHARTAERLLVLNNGRIVKGVVKKSAGGYLLEKPNGSLLVPFEQVKFEATDLSHAYRKLRASLPERSATNHIALARWCLLQQLHEEARMELRDALVLEPSRNDARSMLRRLEEILNPDDPLHLSLPASTPLTSDGFALPEVHSLSGLSHASARAFVSQVQPTLMNKCGNASCHGPEVDNDFRLTPVRIGQTSRVVTERNLAVILNYIDVDAPRNSRLLTEPVGNHGSTGRAIFHGLGAAEQRNSLRDWVFAVAAELAAQERQKQEAPTIARRSAATATRGKMGGTRRRPITPGLPWQRELSLQESPLVETNPVSADRPLDPRDEILERILRDERKDAFDPDAFNRLNGQP